MDYVVNIIFEGCDGFVCNGSSDLLRGSMDAFEVLLCG
jgi:hypothetical protein